MTEPTGGALIVFPVSGDWVSYEAPDPDGDTNYPHKGGPHAFITFTARLPAGLMLPVSNAELEGGRPAGVLLPPVRVRMWTGRLRTINQPNTPDVYLVANDPVLKIAERLAALGDPRLPDTLIYDVGFSNVSYADATASKLVNFAFEAPPDSTPVCITDPDLARLEYRQALP